MWIANIHRELINSLEPSAWKLASETIVAKQNISNTLSFTTWKPSCYKGIHHSKVRLNHNWTAGNKDDNTFHNSTDTSDGAWTGFRDCQIQAVTICFCIWVLSYYDNGIGEFTGLDKVSIRVLLVDDFSCWINGMLYSFKDCCTCTRTMAFSFQSNET